MVDFAIGFLLEEKRGQLSLLLSGCLDLVLTREKMMFCAVDVFTSQGTKFILNSYLVFKNTD